MLGAMLLLPLACRPPRRPGEARPQRLGAAGRQRRARGLARGDTAPPPAYDCGPDHLALTAGVGRIEQGASLPSRLVVHRDQACPVVLDESHRTFVAATTFGAGRALHAGHEGMISDPAGQGGDHATFFLNALRWAGRSDLPTVGVEPGLATLRA